MNSIERRADADRRDPEALLGRIAGVSPDPIAAIDREFRLTAFNRAYREAYRRIGGIEIERGMHLADALASIPEERDNVMEAFSRALAGEEYTIVTPFGPSGNRLTYEVTFGCIRDEDGVVIAAFQLVRDIHERERLLGEVHRLNAQLEERVHQRTADLKAANMRLEQHEEERNMAERALRQSERSFRFLADTIPHLVWTSTAEGASDYFNRRWYEYTGLTHRESRSQGWARALHPDDAAHALEKWRLCLETGEPYSTEYRFRRQDGVYRWFLGLALPLTDEEGNILRWFGTSTDIHDQKEASAERERLYEQMQQASQAKSDFMATMSHELRTPLNAIMGYTDLLEMGIPVPIPESAVDHAVRIRLSAAHLLQLIEEILTFSRLEAGREGVHRTPVDLNDLLHEVRAIIEPLAERAGLRFRCRMQGVNPVIETDPRKLRQILLNLLGNAVKFTSEGKIILAIEEVDGEIRFEVRDTGPGVSDEHLERLFEPFWQGDHTLTRSREGAGLGLAITRRFVEMLGGRIEVRSELGRGSVFSAIFPLGPERGLMENQAGIVQGHDDDRSVREAG